MMILKDLIQRLEREDPDKIIKLGFHAPHSYRGYYEELAFELKRNARIGDMLKLAKQQIGATHYGYKGGEFEMGEYSDVYIATWGHTGQELGMLLLNYMLKDVKEE